jgi:hypothetical protein
MDTMADEGREELLGYLYAFVTFVCLRGLRDAADQVAAFVNGREWN